MRQETEILEKIEELRTNLNNIVEKADAEMTKPYAKRDLRLLRFLNREKNVWQFALQQMEWLLATE
ncbi:MULTISPECIES: hypothetical protein [Niastella]|uniref:Uncharacterized protein n=1 Tax=Niastella soli TaxID=2821487 RepID=A0ABS3YUF6_9BACT|nr:hypothetical protein [Niastella soli]MBO9201554.1 hypothetical protein [Niastella soli]